MDENFHFFGQNFEFRWLVIQKRGSKCWREKFRQISVKIGEKSTLGEKLVKSTKNRRALQFIGEILVCIADFSEKIDASICFPALIWRSKFGPMGCLYLLLWSSNLMAPNFLASICRSKFGPISNDQFHVHLMVQIEFGCDPTTKIVPQRLYDDPMVRIHPDFNPKANFVLQQ